MVVVLGVALAPAASLNTVVVVASRGRRQRKLGRRVARRRSLGRHGHGHRGPLAGRHGERLPKGSKELCARGDHAALDGLDRDKGRGAGADGLEDALIARLLAVETLAIGCGLVATASDLIPSQTDMPMSVTSYYNNNKWDEISKRKTLTLRFLQYLQAMDVRCLGALACCCCMAGAVR